MRKGTVEEEGKLFMLVEAVQNSQKGVAFLIKQSLQRTQSLLSGSLSPVLQVHLGRKEKAEQKKGESRTELMLLFLIFGFHSCRLYAKLLKPFQDSLKILPQLNFSPSCHSIQERRVKVKLKPGSSLF